MTNGFNFNNGKETLRHDARSERTQYRNVLRPLRRKAEGASAQSKINAGRSRRIRRRLHSNRVFLGIGAIVSKRRAFAEDFRDFRAQGRRKTFPVNSKIIERFFHLCIDRIFQNRKINSVKSDGARPKNSTARGGAAFLRKFATSSRAFCLPFPQVGSFPRAVEIQEPPMSVETVRKDARRPARRGGLPKDVGTNSSVRLLEGQCNHCIRSF